MQKDGETFIAFCNRVLVEPRHALQEILSVRQ